METANVTTENVEISFDQNLDAAPSFLRARRKNLASTDIRLSGIRASMPMGSAIFSLANGEITNIRLSDSEFTMDVGPGLPAKIHVVRQNRGDVMRMSNVSFEFTGKGAAELRDLVMKLPAGSRGRLDDLNDKVQYRVLGDARPPVIE